MSKLLYDELYELTINFDRHQFINLLMQKDRKIQDLSTDKQQLNMLVNSCQNEIRKLKEQLQQKEDIINKIKEFVKKHNERAGKLYYKYDNKYLLSEIREDLLKILDNKGE